MARNTKMPLMQKYDLDIDQLDYKFIESCKDVRTLEWILMVLRSGEEGVYPDLVKFCENRLREMAPNSRLLQFATKIKRFRDLSENEGREIENEFESWLNEMKDEEINKEFNFGNSVKMNKDLPPVRGKSVKIEVSKKKEKIIPCENKTKKQRKQRSYSEWDKFDVEEELKKLDESEDNDTPPKDNKRKRNCDSGLQTLVSVSDLTEREREYVANIEKNKGNEAFKAHDYEEAIAYYTRSLSAYKSTVALNNRAQAYVKCKNYFAAVQDCNAVLSMDPENIKALYRRGLALKENGTYDLAVLDFRTLLELDPENKSAKEQLKEIKKMKATKPEKKKVIIEEIKSDEIENGASAVDLGDNDAKCTRMKIEEVKTTENTVKLTNINYSSSDDDDNSAHLSTKVRKMLQINKTPRSQKDYTRNENEIEKTPIRETKRNEKKIEECKEFSPVPNSIGKDTLQDILSTQVKNVTNKNKLDSEFVRVDIEDATINRENPEQSNKCQPEGNKSKLSSSINKNVELKATGETPTAAVLEEGKNQTLSKSLLSNEDNVPKLETCWTRTKTSSIGNSECSNTNINDKQRENEEIKIGPISSKNINYNSNEDKVSTKDDKRHNSQDKSSLNPDSIKDKDVTLKNTTPRENKPLKNPEDDMKNRDFKSKNLYSLVSDNKFTKPKFFEDSFNKPKESKDHDMSINNSSALNSEYVEIKDDVSLNTKRDETDNVNESNAKMLEIKLSSENYESPNEPVSKSFSREIICNQTDCMVVNDFQESITADICSNTERVTCSNSIFDEVHKTSCSNSFKKEKSDNVSSPMISHTIRNIIDKVSTNQQMHINSSDKNIGFQSDENTTDCDINAFTVKDTINNNVFNNEFTDINSESQIPCHENFGETENCRKDNLKPFKPKHLKVYMKCEECVCSDTGENETVTFDETYVKKNNENLANVDVENDYQLQDISIRKSQEGMKESESKELKNEGFISNDTNGNYKPVTWKKTRVTKGYESLDDEFVDVENDYPPQETNVQKFQKRTVEYKVNHENSKCKTTNEDCKVLGKSQSNFKESKLSQERGKSDDYLLNYTTGENAQYNETLINSGLEVSLEDVISKPITLENDVQYEMVSPYEFLCAWCLNGDKDMKAGALNLLKLKPEELPKIISNKLDASMLNGILKAISIICKMGKYAEGKDYLYYLTQVPRINIVSMFLSEEEIKSIHDLFPTLECEHSHMKYLNMILQT